MINEYKFHVLGMEPNNYHITPCAGWRYWTLKSDVYIDMVLQKNGYKEIYMTLIVRKDFETDFATFPPIARALSTTRPNLQIPAVAHDALTDQFGVGGSVLIVYDEASNPSQVSPDELFNWNQKIMIMNALMKYTGVKSWRRFCVVAGVAAYGPVRELMKRLGIGKWRNEKTKT